MQLTVFGEAPLLARLERAAPIGARLRAFGSPAIFFRELRESRPDCVILQTSLLHEPLAESQFRQCWSPEYSLIPLLFAVEHATARELQIAVHLSTGDGSDILLVGPDDKPEPFQRLLQDTIASSFSASILRTLTQSSPLPAHLHSALTQCVARPRSFGSAEALAESANMDLRTLNRHLRKRGIVSSGEFLLVTRVVFAAIVRSRFGMPEREAAKYCGLCGPRRLTTASEELFGVSFARLAESSKEMGALRERTLAALTKDAATVLHSATEGRANRDESRAVG